MNIAVQSLWIVAVLVTLGLNFSSAHAATARFVWQELHSSDTQDLRVKDAVVDAHDATWILLTERPKGALLTQGELRLWRIAADGRRAQTFPVTRPAQHGARHAAVERAFVRLAANGDPVVAARTEAGISVVRMDRDSGVRNGDWLVAGAAAPVGFESRPGSALALITTQHVYELQAKKSPRTVYGGAAAAIVAATPVQNRVALVTLDGNDNSGRELHIGFLDFTDDERPRLAPTALDPDGSLRNNVSYGRGMGIEMLSPMLGDSTRWQRLSFDGEANLIARQLIAIPTVDQRPRTLDAQPLGAGGVLLASAQGAGFWLALLDDDGVVAPIDVMASDLAPSQHALFALDVRLRATADPHEFVLLGTQVTANAATRTNDYGLFVSRVSLSAPISP